MLIYKIDVLAALKKKGYTSYVILKEGLISQSSMTKIRNGAVVSVQVLDKICDMLQMQPGSIIKWIPDEEAEQPQDEKTDEWVN